MSIGIMEILVLLAIPVAGLATLAVIFVVVRAAVRSGNRETFKGK